MVEFLRKMSLVNSGKLNKRNWQKVYAVSNQPCTSILGVPEIEKIKRTEGAYYCKWYLQFDKENGYMFVEQYAKTGISGWHKTAKTAIFCAISKHIKVFLND